MIRVRTRLFAAMAMVAIIGGLLVGRGVSAGPSTPAAPAATPAGTPAVVRAVLGRGEPMAASGQALELVRYTIQPGTTLAVHTHPGMQVAMIEQGTLRYTVVRGDVPITRAGTGASGPVETLAAGQTTELHPGDSFIERAGVIHFGANAGAEPVVILVASLLAADQPPATTIDPAALTPAASPAA